MPLRPRAPLTLGAQESADRNLRIWGSGVRISPGAPAINCNYKQIRKIKIDHFAANDSNRHHVATVDEKFADPGAHNEEQKVRITRCERRNDMRLRWRNAILPQHLAVVESAAKDQIINQSISNFTFS
jgi:hypothetical protein